MKEAYTTTAYIILGDDGILRITMKAGAKVSLADAQNHFEVTQRMLEGKKGLVLVDARSKYTVTAEASEWGKKAAVLSRLATAVVVNSKTSSYVSNLILHFDRPQSPTRMFTSFAEAEKWLKGFGKK